MKYLLWCVVLAVLWWVWNKRRVDVGENPPPNQQRPPEAMVCCAHCRVHFPLSDGVRDGPHHYCCEAHRQAGRGDV